MPASLFPYRRRLVLLAGTTRKALSDEKGSPRHEGSPGTMRQFLADIKRYWNERPFLWDERAGPGERKPHLPTRGRVLVIGPHPDDPECVAVTTRLLMQSGCDIHVAIVTLSPAGVEDEYVGSRSRDDFFCLQEAKRAIRRREQIASAEQSGLPGDHLVFLHVEEGPALQCRDNEALLENHLESAAPDIVILPAGNDPNQTHAWTHRIFRTCAHDLAVRRGKPLAALYNEDPKTIGMRRDLFVCFGEKSAEWKKALLRTHDSQQQRNRRLRGKGFDERILGMNHDSRKHLFEGSPSAAYAEAFEIELFGDTGAFCFDA
ncbi:MAG: PIG-L family deacetylase [Thermodesulfobacteriota bacterium]